MHTAICIASGPSLTKDDVDYCRGKGRVYVVNDCYKLAPWADVLYACDHDWWHTHKGVPDFNGDKWTVNRNASYNFLLNCVQMDTQAIFSKQKGVIATGFNSGFQALNLAYLQGAKKIILLGYDYKWTDKSHWFGDHPKGLQRTPDFKKWLDHYEKAAPLIDIPVINCSPDSDLNCFKKLPLRKAL